MLRCCPAIVASLLGDLVSAVPVLQHRLGADLNADPSAGQRVRLTMGTSWGTLDQKWPQLAEVAHEEVEAERRIFAGSAATPSKWQ